MADNMKSTLRDIGLSRKQLKGMGIDINDLSKHERLQLAMAASRNKQAEERAAHNERVKIAAEDRKNAYREIRDTKRQHDKDNAAADRAQIKADADVRREETKLAPLRQAMRAKEDSARDKEFKSWAESEHGEAGARMAEKHAGLASYAPVTARAEVAKGAAVEGMRGTWDQVAPQYQAALEKKLGRQLSANELRDIANPTEGTMVAANKMLGTQHGQQHQRGQGELDQQQQLRQYQAQQSNDFDIAKRYSLMAQTNGSIPLKQAADKSGRALGYVINGAQDANKLKAAGWRPIMSGKDMGSWVKFQDAGNGLVIQQKIQPSENNPGTYLIATGTARGEQAYLKMHQANTANFADSLRAKGVPEPKIQEQVAQKNFQFFQGQMKENMPRLDPNLANKYKDVAAKDPGRALDAVRNAVNNQEIAYDPRTIAVALHEAQSKMPSGLGKDFVDWVHGGSDEAKKFVSDWTKMYYGSRGEAVVPEKLPFYREPKPKEMPAGVQDKMAPQQISEDALKKGEGAAPGAVSAITGKEIPGVVRDTLTKLADATSTPANAATGPPSASGPGGGILDTIRKVDNAITSSPYNPFGTREQGEKSAATPAATTQSVPAASPTTAPASPVTTAPAQTPASAPAPVLADLRPQSLPAPAPAATTGTPAGPLTPLAALKGAPSLMGTNPEGSSGPGVETQPVTAPTKAPISLMGISRPPQVTGNGSTNPPVSIMGDSSKLQAAGNSPDLNTALEALRGSIGKSVADLNQPQEEEKQRLRIM